MAPITWILFVLSVAVVTMLFFVALKPKSSKKQDKKKKRRGGRGGTRNQPTTPAPTSQATLAPASESEYENPSESSLIDDEDCPSEQLGESEYGSPSDSSVLDDTDSEIESRDKPAHTLPRKQFMLNGVKHRYLAKKLKGKITGASIIPYEIEYEGDHYTFTTPRQVTLYFEDGERTKCTMVPYLGNLKRRATMHFRNSSNIKHENLLNAKLVTFDEVEEQWYIFYDEFKCAFAEWTNSKACTKKWWRTSVKKILEMLEYMHNKNQTHGSLNKTSSYVVVGEDLKILNIKSVDESQKISQKFQDISDFGEFISDKLPMTIVDKTLFLGCFKIDGPACSLDYADFISVLINHPSLMSEVKRLEYFADIHQSKRHRTRLNHSHFLKVINGSTFIDFRDWDTKIIKGGYLDKAKRHGETKETYRGDDIEDLIKLIRNVYVHHAQDGDFTEINNEINETVGTKAYPSFLGRVVIVNDVIYAVSMGSGG
ncbi:hypothetical protein ACFX13_015787 [Malus domestica]